MARLKVLLLSYMISPHRGSEYSVAWNHIYWMSKHCDLTVLYGCAGKHMGDFDDLDNLRTAEILPNVDFIPVNQPRLAQLLNSLNRRGMLTYSFYLAYRIWHRSAGQLAKKLVHEKEFDLVHYLNPIGYREPGELWKLNLPYVWGPVGGATTTPLVLYSVLPISGRIKHGFRALVNWFQLRYSTRVLRALKASDVLLTATTENKSIFKKILGIESHYLPENGVIGNISLNTKKFETMDCIKLIWIGTIEARKALQILIHAIQRSKYASRFEIHIVGSGPLRVKLEAEAEKLGLSKRFVWHGQVDRNEVRELLDAAHLHVVTSVSEGNPTTIWEAMAVGVPTITIDHCGMHDTVTNNTGFKIPVSSYSEIVDGFTSKLDTLAEHPNRIREMANFMLADADRYHWKHRPAVWLGYYKEAIDNYKKSLKNKISSN